ncbi:MAG: DinB family protein [Candidatus Limnocylindria bacterium]
MNGPTVDALVTLSDAALQRRIDTSEGPRSIQFLLYSTLRREHAAAAAVKWRTESAAALAQAQSASRELEAVLAGRPDAFLDSLRDGEWTLRDLLRHVMAVELRYAAQVEYSARRSDEDPVAIPEDRLPCDRLSPPEKGFGDSKIGDIRGLLDLVALARERSDRRLADLPDDVLGRPSRWGQIEIDVRERLHQMGVHIVEATIQVEKMLSAAGERQGEARATTRRILRARGLHERATPRLQLAQLDTVIDSLS